MLQSGLAPTTAEQHHESDRPIAIATGRTPTSCNELWTNDLAHVPRNAEAGLPRSELVG